LKFKTLSIMLALICLFPSCRKFDYNDIQALIEKDFEKIADQPGEIKEVKIDCFVDCNKSMEGFVKGQEFIEFIRNFHFNFNQKYNPTYYSLHEDYRPVDSWENFANDANYNNEYADFEKAFAHIRENAARVSKVYIIISDLRFRNLHAFHGLCSELQGLSLEDLFVQIWAKKTRFSGTVFKETPEGSNIPIPHEGTRPLYAIIIGNKLHFHEIDKDINNLGFWDKKLTFINKIPEAVEVLEASRSFFRQAAQKLPLKTRKPLFSYAFLQRKTDRLSFVFKLQDPIMEQWPGISAGMIHVEAYNILRNKNKKDPAKESADIEFSAVPYRQDEDDNETNGQQQRSSSDIKSENLIKIESKSIKKGGKYLLRILLRPGQLPGWVDEYTCPPNAPDDEYKQKTERFKEILESFLVNRNRPFTLITTYFAVVPN